MLPIIHKPVHNYNYASYVKEIPNVLDRKTIMRLRDFTMSEASGLHRRGSKDRGTHASFYTCLLSNTEDELYPMLEHLWQPYPRITFIEPYEIKRYVEGDEFEEHHDMYINLDEQVSRRMNIIIQMSEPHEYEGGDLLVGDYQCTREFGSVIIFPAVMIHSVTKITKGERYSLIGHGWGNL